MKATSLVIVAIWIYRAVLMGIFHVSIEYVYNAFDTRLDALLVGGLLSILVNREIMLPMRNGLTSTKWLIVAPIMALTFASMLDLTSLHFPLWIRLFSFAVQALVMGVLLLQVVRFAGKEWMFLEHPSIKLLARFSYALYLYHIPAMGEVNWRPVSHKKALAVMATILLATGSFFLIEKPMMNARERY